VEEKSFHYAIRCDIMQLRAATLRAGILARPSQVTFEEMKEALEAYGWVAESYPRHNSYCFRRPDDFPGYIVKLELRRPFLFKILVEDYVARYLV